ncbi:RES domain-containing protein [Pseudomonas reidholzensis]|uniref:RES domain-containing protein n=1 Tax=Pseudomonas reidholzensis TaxID=1785162 RepID=A0A383RQX5_9PSED|nr:RES family NAD+ phosphorylase [Pseudomonas reidholzensis]SYX89163.1 RES domain-containing protein [Pseudomonas reidholzensis]
MLAWRVAKASRADDLSGKGAAIVGGRWNQIEVPALYMGLSPAICSLETFVHAAGRPTFALTISCFELPDDPALYLEPSAGDLPPGWDALPADSPSMGYGTRWLEAGTHLGLIVPSVVLQLEHNVVVNPRHPAISQVHLREVFDFAHDERMFKRRT